MNGADNPNWKGGVSRDNMRYKRDQKARYPERVYARELVRRAVRSGRLQREACARCGSTESFAHHHDYTKPLDVEWLCRTCHRCEHSEHPHPRNPISEPLPTKAPRGHFIWRGKVRPLRKAGNNPGNNSENDTGPNAGTSDPASETISDTD